MSRNSKDKEQNGKPTSQHRTFTIMQQEEIGSGKKSFWPELEITGNVRNLSPAVWQLQHLTSLYLNDNNLSRIPADISRLQHLHHLDLSCNKLRSLPAEIGDLTRLKLKVFILSLIRESLGIITSL
ncbi:Leucine-rich repeat-containing protein 40 [Armadillidium vulgare]|nr:Leucine-rich repeat-containing protein 40 [Armadillidium vulgare]